MQIFRSQDMQKQAATIQDAAMKEPVLITYHDRPRLVLMSMQEYDRLRGRRRPATEGQGTPVIATSSSFKSRDALISYSRGQITRREAMDRIGVDSSNVAEFAKLMNSENIPWPKADRQQAEREADELFGLAEAESSR